MKKIALFTLVLMLLVSTLTFAQQIPEKFWEAPLLLRQGVNDLGGMTVSDVFRDGEFKTNENLDGTISTSSWNETPIEVDGNIVRQTLTLLEGDKVVGEFTFSLWWNSNNGTVILDSVVLVNTETGERVEFSTLSEKLYMINVVRSLKE